MHGHLSSSGSVRPAQLPPALQSAEDGSTLPKLDELVIYAPNVGSGGGLVLLRELLATAWPVARLTAILDRRGRDAIGPLSDSIDVHWAEPSLAGRWHAEKLLTRLTSSGQTTLCFHNLPPILARRARVLCYIQNAYVIGLIPTDRLRIRLRARILLERVIAHGFRRRVDRYIVQTATMADAVRNWYGSDAPPIDVLPFAPADDALDRGSSMGSSGASMSGTEERQNVPTHDFIYVSDGSRHKNHQGLFAAWQILADQGFHPSLAVTLHPERDAALANLVRDLAGRGLRIVDLGQIAHADVLAAYGSAGALIFPSFAESFGLPLIEAKTVGLPILASERDYVRDLCVPAETFDPASPRSIARAVRRHLSEPEFTAPPPSGDAFATALCDLNVDHER